MGAPRPGRLGRLGRRLQLLLSRPQPGCQPGAQSGPQISLAAAHPQPAALTRFALPGLLILGGLAALAGSSVLLGTSEGGIRGSLRAFGTSTAAMGRSAWTRVRPNRTAAK